MARSSHINDAKPISATHLLRAGNPSCSPVILAQTGSRTVRIDVTLACQKYTAPDPCTDIARQADDSRTNSVPNRIETDADVSLDDVCVGSAVSDRRIGPLTHNVSSATSSLSVSLTSVFAIAAATASRLTRT